MSLLYIIIVMPTWNSNFAKHQIKIYKNKFDRNINLFVLHYKYKLYWSSKLTYYNATWYISWV